MKLYLLIVFFTVFIPLSFGQVPSVTPLLAQTPENDEQPIKVNTNLVNIPIIASDRDGRYIGGLTKDNFTVTQDGEKQPIEFFANEQAPMNVAILIDDSLSTSGFIGDIQEAAKDFVKVFRPEDQGLVANFDSAIKGYNKFTSDQKQLFKAINKTGGARGSSNMQDAIYQLVTKVFVNIKGRKAIIVLTDGYVSGDITNERLLYSLEESDVLVYPILFGKTMLTSPRASDIPKSRRLPTGKIITREEVLRSFAQARHFFESLGTVTGGRLYKKDKGDFKKIFLDIANELKNLYLVGFYLQNFNAQKTHNISITVSPKDIIIRAKRNISLKTPQ